MRAGRPILLIVAKAPVPGLVKTRLTPPFTPHQAAALAAAALLDTLDACRTAATLTGAQVVVALAGELDAAMAGTALKSALVGVRVLPQRGEGLAARLAAAHLDAAGNFGTTLQVGMDTPQLEPAVLAQGLARLAAPEGPDAVLGLAEDGGWWALGLRDPAHAEVLRDVPMSTAETGARTLASLRERGLRVASLPVLSDVDTATDARAVAALCPAGSRFAAVVPELLAAKAAP